MIDGPHYGQTVVRLYGDRFDQLLTQGWLQIRDHTLTAAAQVLGCYPHHICGIIAGQRKLPNLASLGRIQRDMDAAIPRSYEQLFLAVQAYLNE